jgi:hypothetical protein
MNVSGWPPAKSPNFSNKDLGLDYGASSSMGKPFNCGKDQTSPTPAPPGNGASTKSGTVAGLMEGFIKKQAGQNNAAAAGSKMVTIRRVMEPNGSDPTVTISMKGDTPEQDQLMFTLVNGQGLFEV